MSGVGFLRVKKIKGPGMVAAAARHNKRTIQAELGARNNIDPLRMHLNESIAGPPTPDEVSVLAKNLKLAAGITKTRKDAVQALELVFSLPANHQVDELAYFQGCLTWTAARFGGQHNILSADIHRDEACPHCHVLMLPLIDGRMVGSDLVGNRQRMVAMHNQFHADVASRHGLKKPPTGLTKAAKESAAVALLKYLTGNEDPALRSAIWPQIREAFEKDPAPFLLALGLGFAEKPKKLRSMTQVFTSKGKGPSKEPNPIGFEARQKARTLCSVGFGAKPSAAGQADA